MKVCKLFKFRYRVALGLRSTGENDVGWKLTPANIDDEDVNSRSNSLQPKEDDIEWKAKDSIKKSNN